MHKLEIIEGHEGKKLSLEFHKDSSSEDMKEVFSLVMKFLTFGDIDWLKDEE